MSKSEMKLGLKSLIVKYHGREVGKYKQEAL